MFQSCVLHGEMVICVAARSAIFSMKIVYYALSIACICLWPAITLKFQKILRVYSLYCRKHFISEIHIFSKFIIAFIWLLSSFLYKILEFPRKLCNTHFPTAHQNFLEYLDCPEFAFWPKACECILAANKAYLRNWWLPYISLINRRNAKLFLVSVSCQIYCV